MAFKSPFFPSNKRRLQTIRGSLKALRRTYDDQGDANIAEEIARQEHAERKVLEAAERQRTRDEARPPEQRQATIAYFDWTVAQVDATSPESAVIPYSARALAAVRREDALGAVVRLPVVDDDKTPVANLLLASPLFAATRRAAAEPGAELSLGKAWVDGKWCTLLYEGPRLTTSHGDAFLACLDYVKSHHFDAEVRVPVREFLRKVGRSESSGANHASLAMEFKELHKGTFFLVYESASKVSRVRADGWRLLTYDIEKPIGEAALNPESVLTFTIPSVTATLFGLKAWASLDLKVRASMDSAVSKWLYGYICSRSCPGAWCKSTARTG